MSIHKSLLMKHSCIISIILFLFIGNINTTFAKTNVQRIDSIYKESGMFKVAKTIHNNGWIEFRENVAFDKNSFFKDNKHFFGLGKDDELTFDKENIDNLGFVHCKYHQTYKGLKVEFSDIIIHSREGIAEKTSGKPCLYILVNITPSINEDQAIQIAINDILQNNLADKDFIDKRDPSYLKPELVILPQNENFQIKENHLAYKFDLVSYKYLIDAHTSEVLLKYSNISKADVVGEAYTVYSGDHKPITTYFNDEDELYYLQDNVRGVITKDLENYEYFNTINSESLTDPKPITNTTLIWFNPNNASISNTPNDIHWGMEKTLDYYSSGNPYFSRDSYDNNHAIVNCFVHLKLNGRKDNAYHSPPLEGVVGAYDIFTFGDGDSEGPTIDREGPFVSLDIVSHEFTHAVTYYTSGLINGNSESGALNEGFSDIMSAAVENWVGASDKNPWLVGEEVMEGHSYSCIRSLRNPTYETLAQFHGPTTYHGTGWDNGNEPHTNGMLLGYWFYILSQGYGSTVSGISIQPATGIIYRAITSYLTSTSVYADARQATIEAAADLYGNCSNEVKQVIAAWNAVGVTAPTLQTDITASCGDIPDGKIYLATNNIYTTSGCITTVNPNTAVTFRAGNSISLKPGFHASRGSLFNAELLNCSNGIILKSAEENDENGVIDDAKNSQNNKITSNITIHPNPTTDFIIVNGLDEFDASILDLTGRTIIQISKANGRLEFNNLKPGIYMLIIKSEGISYSQKIIKQ